MRLFKCSLFCFLLLLVSACGLTGGSDDPIRLTIHATQSGSEIGEVATNNLDQPELDVRSVPAHRVSVDSEVLTITRSSAGNGENVPVFVAFTGSDPSALFSLTPGDTIRYDTGEEARFDGDVRPFLIQSVGPEPEQTPKLTLHARTKSQTLDVRTTLSTQPALMADGSDFRFGGADASTYIHFNKEGFEERRGLAVAKYAPGEYESAMMGAGEAGTGWSTAPDLLDEDAFAAFIFILDD